MYLNVAFGINKSLLSRHKMSLIVSGHLRVNLDVVLNLRECLKLNNYLVSIGYVIKPLSTVQNEMSIFLSKHLNY